LKINDIKKFVNAGISKEVTNENLKICDTEVTLVNYYILNEKDKILVQKAIDILGENYQHGKHTVSSTLYTSSKKYYTGINIKSLSYGLCAEPIAIGSAISCGEKDVSSIVAIGFNGSEYIVYPPCGNCRQLLITYFPKCNVIINHDEQLVKVSIKNLIPSHFH